MNVRTGILIFAGLLLAKTSEAQLFGKKLGESRQSAIQLAAFATIISE